MDFLLYTTLGTGSGVTEGATGEAENKQALYFCECLIPVLQKQHLTCGETRQGLSSVGIQQEQLFHV